MSYNENTIETKVQVIITPDVLSYFELDVTNIALHCSSFVIELLFLKRDIAEID